MTNHDLSHYGPVPKGTAWVPPSQRSAVAQRETRATALPYSDEIHPQLRTDSAAPVSSAQAVSIPAVFRCLDVLTTAMGQLPLTVERQGRTLKGRQVPGLIRRPSLDMSTSEFLVALTMSLAVTGNAFIHTDRVDGEIVSLDVWNPHGVYSTKNQAGRKVYWHDGKTYPASDVRHLKRMALPGEEFGKGPIQAANASLYGAVRQRAFSSMWFDGTGQPTGILSTEQELNGTQSKQLRNLWNGLDPETGEPVSQHANPSGIKVLGNGMSYRQLHLSPKDAMWIEAQNFTTLEIARIFGVPPNLLYAAIEGNSMTYSNVEQSWLEFSRFTLLGYIRPIEDALTDLVPMGQRVKINMEGLLRSDTKTRYEAHRVGIEAGFLSVNEVRVIEGLEPVDGLDQLTPKTENQETA